MCIRDRYKSQPLSAAQASYPGGVCVVIGSEGQGLTDETIAACSSTVRIPMTDRVESCLLYTSVPGGVRGRHGPALQPE